MQLTDIVKKYPTFHLTKPRTYTGRMLEKMLDSDNDSPEKHMDRSRLAILAKLNPKNLLKKKNKAEITRFDPDQEYGFWIEYAFSPAIYEQFQEEIDNEINYSAVGLGEFLSDGFFKSNPKYKVNIFRSFKLFDDGPETAMGRTGRIHYLIMDKNQAENFDLNIAEKELKLGEIAKLEYKEIKK